MWRDYAEEGAGCAIVFDARKLFAGCDGGNAYSFAPVIYDERIQIDTTTKIVDKAIWLQRNWNPPPRMRRRYWLEEVMFWLLACGFRFKAPCWRDEKEVRIAVPERDGLKPFRQADKMRVAVSREHDAVVRIVRGPNTNAGTAEQIRDTLCRAGYRDDLVTSQEARRPS